MQVVTVRDQNEILLLSLVFFGKTTVKMTIRPFKVYRMVFKRLSLMIQMTKFENREQLNSRTGHFEYQMTSFIPIKNIE